MRCPVCGRTPWAGYCYAFNAVLAVVIVMVLLTIFGCAPRPQLRAGEALAPRVKVVNMLDHACQVDATAEDGGEVRIFGVVASRDSATWRIPFPYQVVTFGVCGAPQTVDVDGPYTWTITAQPRGD